LQNLKKCLWNSGVLTAILFSEHNVSMERIQTQSVNKAKVSKVFVAPGLATLVRFPCVIKEAVVGNSKLVNAQISEKDAQTIILNIASSTKTATNLIVRCISQRSPFVFDVISSRSNHQDYLEVSSGYGRPNYKASDLKLISSSGQAERGAQGAVEIKRKKLIKTYKIKGE
jgi:hypothetical protein